jgi:hypothetical protein
LHQFLYGFSNSEHNPGLLFNFVSDVFYIGAVPASNPRLPKKGWNVKWSAICLWLVGHRRARAHGSKRTRSAIPKPFSRAVVPLLFACLFPLAGAPICM